MSQSTFRLLRLHAGHGDRITGELHHYDLSPQACPAYRAVSYTWGEEIALDGIHMPGNSVIQLHKNLRTALLSIRETGDCWLWIDAVCIDQRSNEERNHQVRLMADIYRIANVVLVWLQSADESADENADVARAFKFVQAAATYDDSDRSIYYYSKAHRKDNKGDWRSVRDLCKLRYWTRKWIIQELVTARTVVLHAGNAECPMTHLESFCSKLYRQRDNPVYKKMGSARRFVVGSSATRLALQRLETREQPRPRFLYDLTERYATNNCQLPCDHVYALWSLVGPHRTHLRIDYAATPVQRLVAVLRFVQTYEQLHPSKVLEFANLLLRLFQIKHEDISAGDGLAEALNLIVHPSVLGTVELPDESNGSRALRQRIQRLDPMARFVLDTSRAVWPLVAKEQSNDSRVPVSQQDMTYFRIQQSGFHGLAACRLEAGDVIWHFPTTQLVFATRRMNNGRAYILGRACLFFAARKPDTFDFWLSRPLEYDRIHQGAQPLSVNWSTLLELGSLASREESVWKEDEDSGKQHLRMIPRRRFVMIGCGKSNFHPKRSVRVIG